MYKLTLSRPERKDIVRLFTKHPTDEQVAKIVNFNTYGSNDYSVEIVEFKGLEVGATAQLISTSATTGVYGVTDTMYPCGTIVKIESFLDDGTGVYFEDHWNTYHVEDLKPMFVQPKEPYEMTEKFKITLSPDTAQRTFRNLTDVELDVDILKFKDESIRVTIPKISPNMNHRYFKIECFIESMDDLMVLAQIKEVVDRLFKCSKVSTLLIKSTSYSRYDRVMLEGGIDGFGAKCFANLINALQFDNVCYLDCHSEVLIGLTYNAWSVPQDVLVGEVVGNVDHYNLVAPDKGAVAKNRKASVICNKTRDVTTGHINGVEIDYYDADESKPFLIIDDICEGGRTFIEVGKLINDVASDLHCELYVTHGIFSNNAIHKLLEYYKKIHVYIMKKSVYDTLTDLDKSKLNVKNLINL